MGKCSRWGETEGGWVEWERGGGVGGVDGYARLCFSFLCAYACGKQCGLKVATFTSPATAGVVKVNTTCTHTSATGAHTQAQIKHTLMVFDSKKGQHTKHTTTGSKRQGWGSGEEWSQGFVLQSPARPKNKGRSLVLNGFWVLADSGTSRHPAAWEKGLKYY